jgi:hypothetical protein
LVGLSKFNASIGMIEHNSPGENQTLLHPREVNIGRALSIFLYGEWVLRSVARFKCFDPNLAAAIPLLPNNDFPKVS